MKRANFQGAAVLVVLGLVGWVNGAWAQAGLQRAEVTRILNTVEILEPGASPKDAAVGDEVEGQTAVQTGNQSRAELEFNDATLARLGANSIFSFEEGTRDLTLQEGAVLLEVPKNAGGATINTAAVTAAVTGTTVMIEFRKALKRAEGIIKFIVLEGTMRLQLRGQVGESILLTPGQMVSLRPNATRIPDPVQVDLARLVETSGLMSSDFKPLRNESFVSDSIREQQTMKAQGKLIRVNYGLKGKKNNPVLQSINTTTQQQLRSDSTEVPNQQQRNPQRQQPVRRNAPVVNAPKDNPKPPRPPEPPPKPPKPDPPKPPKRPDPIPKPPKPTPPPVPPAPQLNDR